MDINDAGMLFAAVLVEVAVLVGVVRVAVPCAFFADTWHAGLAPGSSNRRPRP